MATKLELQIEWGDEGVWEQGEQRSRGAGEARKEKLLIICPVPNPQCPIPSAQSPVPNPQYPVPNPKSPVPNPKSPVPNPKSQI
ncbi:MAG: hypothetical protein V7L22_13285 [Nostoc sp.]|uniref:hypothetical protein n=1 Tax=Nostoc sp. TaxID=1180 RepID=UPI002FFD1BDF